MYGVTAHNQSPTKYLQDIPNGNGLTLNKRSDRGVHYCIDGTGRDTYVFNDNGGFCDIKKPRD